MTYDTVVFDNDGVLVGRTRFDVLRDATRNAFEECGVEEPDPDDVERMTIGATPGSVGTVCQTYDLDPGSFWRTRDDVVSKAQQQEAREGRKTPYDDLNQLQDLEVEMGIVSSNQQATVDFLVNHFDGFDRFGAAYGREPTIHSLQLRKPNPHYIEQALGDLGAGNALFVGDNESDVRAAENAGIDSAFIRRPHRRDWELNVWPTWEIERLSDLHDIVG